jgi:queuosine precursor transporter
LIENPNQGIQEVQFPVGNQRMAADNQQPLKPPITTIILSAAYVAAQMMADIGSLRILILGSLAVDGGTFIYPFTFTLRDMIHKWAGKQAARTIILTSAVINLVMAWYFWMVGILPADLRVGPQQEFVTVLSPVWRIVLASIIAEVIAELIDTEIYHLWVTRITTRFQWARVLVSNSISVPIDSLIFAWGAFGGVLPAAVVWSIVASNILIKGLTTLISLPWIYLVKERHIE